MDGFYAITELGKLFCIGENTDGTIGTGTVGSVDVLTEISSPKWFTQVAQQNRSYGSAVSHRIALAKDGSVLTWGVGTDGCLGNNTMSGNVTVPTEISAPSNVVKIFSGNGRQYLVTGNGALYAFGNDDNHALGCGGVETNRSTPTATQLTSGVSHVVGTVDGTAVLKADGTIWVVGKNTAGMFGLGDAVDTVYQDFTQVGTDTDWANIAYHSLGCVAHKTNGDRWACGTGTDHALPGYFDSVYLTLQLQTFEPLTTVMDFVGVNSRELWRYRLYTDSYTYYQGSNGVNGVTFGNGATEAFSEAAMGVYSVGSAEPLGNEGYDYVSQLDDRVFGIKRDGTIWVWGQSTTDLGAVVSETSSNVPKQELTGRTDWLSVSNQRVDMVKPTTESSCDIYLPPLSVSGACEASDTNLLSGDCLLPTLKASSYFNSNDSVKASLPKLVVSSTLGQQPSFTASITLSNALCSSSLHAGGESYASVALPKLAAVATGIAGIGAIGICQVPSFTVSSTLSASNPLNGDIDLPFPIVLSKLLSNQKTSDTIARYEDGTNPCT